MRLVCVFRMPLGNDSTNSGCRSGIDLENVRFWVINLFSVVYFCNCGRLFSLNSFKLLFWGWSYLGWIVGQNEFIRLLAYENHLLSPKLKYYWK